MAKLWKLRDFFMMYLTRGPGCFSFVLRHYSQALENMKKRLDMERTKSLQGSDEYFSSDRRSNEMFNIQKMV